MPPNQLAFGHLTHARHRTQFLAVGQRQREHQGNGVARHQAGAGCRLGAGVPGADDGPQQTEGGDGDDDAHDRQRRAQRVPERVPGDELGQQHGWRGAHGPGRRQALDDRRISSLPDRHGVDFAGMVPAKLFSDVGGPRRPPNKTHARFPVPPVAPVPRRSAPSLSCRASAAARALVLPLAALAGLAQAIGLGEITQQSALGAPLRVVVPVIAGTAEELAGECVRIVAGDRSADGIPEVRDARIALERTAAGVRIVVIAPRAVTTRC